MGKDFLIFITDTVSLRIIAGMKDIFGRIFPTPVDAEDAKAFARKLSIDNCRRAFVVNIICISFLSVLLLVDIVRHQTGQLWGNPRNMFLMVTHLLVGLQIYPFWMIRRHFSDIKNGKYRFGGTLVWITLISLALALLPMSVMIISTRASVALFAIYLGTINIVAILPPRERLWLNGGSLLVMMASVVVIQWNHIEMLVVNIAESLAVAIPNVIFATFQYNLTLKQFKDQKALEAQKLAINSEKQLSERLLYNILPVPVAQELKIYGKVTPVLYPSASVLFTDFKDFTSICRQLSPQQLIDDLSYCFSGFDQIIAKYEIERVKTIGDAYMCVAGVPSGMPDHAVRMAQAALEIQHFLEKWKAQKQAGQQPFYEARIGIHSGPLVAGVAGVAKFAFDTWGETVNIAARMEQNSHPNRINISGETYQLVKNHFTCTPRGEITAKNIGAIEMYFIEGWI